MSPIGAITFSQHYRKSTLADLILPSIREEHGKSAAQVMLRWHVQQGRSAIPKSVKPARIVENFDIFGFDLSSDDLAAIDGLDTVVRGGPNGRDHAREMGRLLPEA